MDPVMAWILVIVVGLYLAVLTVILVRRWNRENREKYPDRYNGRFFQINRTPRR